MITPPIIYRSFRNHFAHHRTASHRIIKSQNEIQYERTFQGAHTESESILLLSSVLNRSLSELIKI